MDKNFDLTVGFAHERFRYSDVAFDGYNYTIVTGVNQNLLTGAYAFPNYNASIVYATVKYKLP